MRINRQELLQVLESLQPGLTNRDIVEQSSCFAFMSDGTVASFNDEISCRRKSPLEIEGAVQAMPLLAILRKLSEEEIEVNLEENELIIRGKGRRTGIRTQKEVSLPIEKVEEPEDWQKLHADFSDAIYVAQQCVGKDESNYTSTCIHVHPKFIESCDNHQAIRYKLKTRVKEPMLVRGASIKHIISLDMTEFCETETWIHFRNGTGLVLSCRRDTQSYEDLTNILNVEGEPITLPKGLADAADKAEIFSSENADENEVLVKIKEGRMSVTGEGVSGWYIEGKKVKYHGDPISFRIGPKLLIELVKRYHECNITPDRLKVNGGKFCYVVALAAPDNGHKEE